jgi:hypothetical protein
MTSDWKRWCESSVNAKAQNSGESASAGFHRLGRRRRAALISIAGLLVSWLKWEMR